MAIRNNTFEGSVYDPIEAGRSPATGVEEFQEALTKVKISPPQIVNIDEVIAQTRSMPEKSLTQSCAEVVEDQVDSDWNERWYVDSEESAAAMYGLHRLLISRTNIAETSAHQVFFARLSGGHHSVRAAIKPFEEEPKKAIREWVNMKVAASRGFDVFRPLGFLISGGKGYMVTERQDDVESMENSDWTQVLRSPEHNKGLIEDLQKVGPTLARVHNKGCYHGDTQMKNLVVTQSGEVNLIDWEAATFAYTGLWRFRDEEKEPSIRRKAVHDLQVLFSSLARPVENYGVGMMDHLTPKAQFSYFKEYILGPYVEERLKLMGAERTGDLEDMEAALFHIGEVEHEVGEYILSGNLQNSLARSRQT